MKDRKELEKLLKDGGAKDPKGKLDAMATTLKEKGVADTDIGKIIQNSVMAFVNAQKRGMSPNRGLCIGVDSKRDIMEGIRKKALEAYAVSPDQALIEGLVRVEGDKVIPLDTKEKYGDRPNPNFGKPIKVVTRRNAVFITDGGLVMVSGNYDIKPGYKYTFWGSLDEEHNRVTGAKSFVPIGPELALQDIWDQTTQICEQSPAAVDMIDLLGVSDNSVVAILGYVSYFGELSEGIYAIVTDYESGSEVICFASGMTGVLENAQVIVVGRKFTTVRDGEKRPAINASAMVQNPSSELEASVAEELDTILMEE